MNPIFHAKRLTIGMRRFASDFQWAYRTASVSGLSNFKQQSRFFFRAALHLRASAFWFRFLKNSYLRDIAAIEPHLIEAVHRPFFDKNITAKHRARLLKSHFELLPGILGSRQTSHVMNGKNITLCEFDGKHGEQFAINMVRDDAFKREGAVTLVLTFHGVALIYLTFTMVKHSTGTFIMVGGIQAGKGGCRETLRNATHSLHGIQPRLLLLDALRNIATEIDCTKIECISKVNHIYGAWRYRFKKHIHAEYDQLWLLAGGMENSNGNFDIPIHVEQKSIESRPSNKRSEYRRRHVLLESIRNQIRFQP